MRYTCKLAGGVFFSLAVVFLYGLFFSNEVLAQSEHTSEGSYDMDQLPSGYPALYWPVLPVVTKEIHVRSVEQFNIAASQPGTRIWVEKSLEGDNLVSASDVDIIVKDGIHIDALHVNSGVKRIRINGGSYNEMVIKAPISFWPQYEVSADFIVEDVVIENVNVRSEAYYAFFGMARRLAILNSKFLSDSSTFASESPEGVKGEYYIIAGNEFRCRGPLPNISITGADKVVFADNVVISNNAFNQVNFQIDAQSASTFIGRNKFVGTGISLSSEKSFVENNIFYHSRGILFESQLLDGALTVVDNTVYSDISGCLVCDAYLTNWTVGNNSINYYQEPVPAPETAFFDDDLPDQTVPPEPNLSVDFFEGEVLFPAEEQYGMRPFFIGNTLLNEWIPKMVDDIAYSLGKKNLYKYDETYLTGTGVSLSWHYNHPYDGRGADPFVELIQPGKYNALVLTDAIPADNFKEETKEFAHRFYQLAIRGNPEIDLFLFATWVHKENLRFSDWSASVDREAGVWEEIRAHLAVETGRNNIYIIPGGLALKRLVAEADAGRVPGIETGDAFFEDDFIHLNALGNYFISLVHMVSLYRMNPVGATHVTNSPWGGENRPLPNPQLAKKMQEIAWDVVSKYPLGGVAASTVESSCGDGVVDPKAACDDGNLKVGDGCSSNCTPERDRTVISVPARAEEKVEGPKVHTDENSIDGGKGSLNPSIKEASKETAMPSAIETSAPSARVGINLNWNYNDIQQWMFVDAMKHARSWKTRNTDGRQGWDTQMSSEIKWREDGYPVEVPFATANGPQTVFTMLLYNHELADNTWPAGEYSVFYDGDGELSFGEDAALVSRIPGYCRIAVEPRAYVELQILRSDRDNPVRNIRVIMPGFEETYASNPFHPLFLERLGGASSLKFTHPAVTDFHPNGSWKRRVTPDYFSQGTQKGIALEYMVQLANLTRKDPWFNLPHGADKEYIRNYAEFLRDHLDDGLVAYIEYSNELWNEAYGQSLWIREKGCKDPDINFSGNDGAAGEIGRCDDSAAGIGATAKRMVEVFSIFDAVFSGQSQRIVKVFGGAFERDDYNDRLWDHFNDPGINPAGIAVDAFAIAPYFGNMRYLLDSLESDGVRDLSVHDILEFAADDLQENVTHRLSYYSDWAGARNLKLLAYGAGNHLTCTTGGQALAQKVENASRHPRMGELYLNYFEAWKAAGGDLMMLSNYVGLPVPGETGGLLEYQDQPLKDAYMYQAVMLAAGKEKVMARCGNGVTEAWEGCDDGNRVDLDGCSHFCMIE